MSKIFLSTHGKMASGMKSSIDILMGSSENLTVFDAYLAGVNTSVNEAVDRFLAACDPQETKLLISDMLGGSVNQVLAQYSQREDVFVITGITLSLLLELMCRCSNNFTREELEELVENSKAMTKVVTLDFEAKEEAFF